MPVVVKGGTGDSLEAGVDKRNRFTTASIVETESNYHTQIGLKYNINTGDITINDAVKLTVLYIKNNDNRDLYIDALIYNLGSSTAGSGDVLIDVIRNPTSGDIITNANNTAVGSGVEANLNYGSNLTLNADLYKGAQGETVISGGGENILTRNSSTSGRIFISPGGGVILPKGSSIAFNYTPPAGNTTQIVQFAVNAYVREQQ
jgi:hypothetical protein